MPGDPFLDACELPVRRSELIHGVQTALAQFAGCRPLIVLSAKADADKEVTQLDARSELVAEPKDAAAT